MFKVSLNGREVLQTENSKTAYETLAFNSLKGGVCVMSEDTGIDKSYEPIHVVTRSEAKEHKKRR